MDVVHYPLYARLHFGEVVMQSSRQIRAEN